MSTAEPFRAISAAAETVPGVDLTRTHVPSETEVVPKLGIRRRPNPDQGRGLEKLGHAVEYLIDSRMALVNKPATRADAEAVDILMRLSRSVFAECEEIVPVGRRLKQWVLSKVSGRSH